MKKLLLFLMFISFLSLNQLYSQNRTLSGRLVDDSGEPLIGATILVKGTPNGTVTDLDGHYSITAPVGSILIFSYTGFGTREVLVTAEGPAKPQRATKDGSKQPTAEPSAVVQMDQSSTSYILMDDYGWNNSYTAKDFPYHISSVKYLSAEKASRKLGYAVQNGVYLINSGESRKLGFKVRYSSSLAWNRPGKLPALQNRFAQGQPGNGSLRWYGPESGTIFSWGPPLENLEFDGSAYGYDQNGRLGPLGSGTGLPARAYDPYSFFKTGHTLEHDMELKIHYAKNWFFNLGYHQLSDKSLVPQAEDRYDNFKFAVQHEVSDQLRVGYHLDLADRQSQLGLRGANLAGLFYSLATTPPSFDNRNAYPRKTAVGTAATFTTEDGLMRSYAPNRTANPYFLINDPLNTDRQGRVRQSMDLKLNTDAINVTALLSYERSKQLQQFAAFAPGSWEEPAHSAARDKIMDQGYAQLNLSTEIHPGTYYDHRLTARLVGAFFYDQLHFRRWDPADSRPDAENRTERLIRKSSTLLQQISYHYNDRLHVDLQNNTYVSSTLGKASYFNPSAGLSWQTYFGSSYFLDHGQLFASFSRNMTELPVHYSSLEYNTLSLPSAGFNNYFESGELFYRAGLEPEQLRKFELGGELGLWNNRLETTFTYYHDSRDRAIFPFFADTEMTLVNGADITNRGVEAAISFRAYSTDLSWNIKLNFSHNRSKVEKIHVAAEEIPIAGFSDIHKSLIEGQPVGVLVGTRYARNPDGDMIIGSDGYPLVDERTGIIGDPNPDWTAGLQNQLSWKGLALSFLLNLEKGGDSWNGTQNVLNYHGTSALTGQERSIRDYIFPGVNEAGIVNTMTVNFADSDQEMSGNRWVRYGLTGVAEAAIEEASSLWLQEIALHYTVPRYILHDLHLSSIKLSVFARNLLLFTPYQGVDPGSSLFGYEHGRGLDLFNLPGMRSFGLKLQLGL